MLIAIPSDDESTIAPRLGMARGFLIFEVDQESLVRTGYRHLHADDNCTCTPEKRSHRHQLVLDTLEGCSVVVARGIVVHMCDDLHACGFHVAVTNLADAETAVARYAAGTLTEPAGIGCEPEQID